MTWDKNNYKMELNGTAEKLSEQVKKACSQQELEDLSCSIKVFFTQYVKDFFSSAGAGDRIKKVYSSIMDYSPCKKRISVQNINSSNSTYMQYLSGMDVFIDKNLGCTEDGFSATVNSYIDKDSQFVASLFGNGTNVVRADDITIYEALVNLEVLIDFLPKLDGLLPRVQRMFSSCSDTSTGSCMQLAKMYLLSMIRYSNNLIANVFDCFSQIEDALFSPPIKMTESKQEAFKLFL